MDGYSINHENGHYVLRVNGEFYGSHDSFFDAVKDLEDAKRKEEQKNGSDETRK